ncbi:hypothetical protein ABPG77_005716 [Micractinium sp. CCAP 211/92]
MTVPVGNGEPTGTNSQGDALGELIALDTRSVNLPTSLDTTSVQPARSGEALICKHWRTRGFCLFGERCAFRHPPECLKSLVQEHAQLAARQAALNTSNSGRRGGARPGQRRKEPKNKFRASAFRRFLIDTFGRELLQQGTGVLDVAGGRGELAFELLNLNGMPATVVEPRPLDLARRVKWLMTGFYHWNAAFARYNDRRWGAPQPSSSPAAQLAPGAAAAPQPLPWQQHEQQQEQQPLLMPDHLRLVVTPDLAACLTDRLGENSAHSSDSRGEGSRSSGAHTSSSAQSCASAPPEWAALFEAARVQARRGEWLHPAAEHGGGCGPSSSDALGSDESAASLQGGGDASQSEGPSSAPRSGASSPEPVATPALASPRRSALAWTIPAEDSDSEAEGEAPSQEADLRRPLQPAAGGALVAALGPARTEPRAASQHEMPRTHHQPGPTVRADPAAVAAAQAAAAAACAAAEVTDPAAAWQRFTQCSLVCGMHPDGATEFIVDLALALGKPFAVVPCCVYAAAMPRQAGGTTSRYEQFLAYLAAKDPAGRIQVATLPFEGRNKVLYRLP